MFHAAPIVAATKAETYAELARQAAALFEGERDPIANAANLSALIFLTLPRLNWAGFYFLRRGMLVLGPFQGKPACVRIEVGKGVCGTALAAAQSQVVADVFAFPGHIACDPDSRSELVVPLLRNGRAVGVLDMDSPEPGRFDDEDRAGCETLAALYAAASDPEPLPA